MILSREWIIVAGVCRVNRRIGRIVKASLFLQGIAGVAHEEARGLIDVVIHAAGVFGEVVGEIDGCSNCWSDCSNPVSGSPATLPAGT